MCTLEFSEVSVPTQASLRTKPRLHVTPSHKTIKRDYLARMVDNKVECMLKVKKEYEFDYYDGDRRYGYGGISSSKAGGLQLRRRSSTFTDCSGTQKPSSSGAVRDTQAGWCRISTHRF
jgi:hypothetical protein